MPLFPNIGTLVTKATLNGQEVIQISATEKVTLQQIVDQLGFTPSGLLTGLTSASDGSFSLPAATDTLLQALSKIVSRVGGDKMIILPVPRADDNPGEIRFVILIDNTVFTGGTGGIAAVLSIYGPRVSILTKSWENASGNPLNSVTDAEGLVTWVGQGDSRIKLWGETFKETSSNTAVSFDPGDVIFHTGNSITSIVINLAFWNSSAEVFSQNSALLITKVNVTKSMFNAGSGGTFSNVTYLFQDGFDDAPGTEYQCITIQKVRSISGQITLMVNKGGYDPVSSL